MGGIRISSGGGEQEFGVMSVPGRKQKALYRTRGANIDVLAYFRSDGCAEQFERLLDWVIEAHSRSQGTSE